MAPGNEASFRCTLDQHHKRSDSVNASLTNSATVFSPGFLQRAGGGGGGGGGARPCPCTVSLLCVVLLANGVQQTDNGRRRTVVHRNVPLIIRLPRCVIANLVLASCYKAIRARRLQAMPLFISHLNREHVAPRVKSLFEYSYVRGVHMNNGRPHRSTKRGGAPRFRALMLLHVQKPDSATIQDALLTNIATRSDSAGFSPWEHTVNVVWVPPCTTTVCSRHKGPREKIACLNIHGTKTTMQLCMRTRLGQLLKQLACGHRSNTYACIPFALTS